MFTRRRFISAGIFIFAMSLGKHAAWAEPAPAWAPWIALEEAEGGQLSAPIRTQRLLGLGRAFMLHRRPNPDVERLVAEMEKRIAVLDAASFYDLLGRGHPDSKDARWFELEGRWAGTTYPLKAWRRAPRPDDFGELSAHFGLRPAVTKGGFVLEAALSGHLGDLRFEHVAAFVREVMAWLEAMRQDPGDELRLAFPRTAPLIQRYATVGAELSPGEAGSRVRLRIALQNEHIREDFPHLVPPGPFFVDDGGAL